MIPNGLRGIGERGYPGSPACQVVPWCSKLSRVSGLSLSGLSTLLSGNNAFRCPLKLVHVEFHERNRRRRVGHDPDQEISNRRVRGKSLKLFPYKIFKFPAGRARFVGYCIPDRNELVKSGLLTLKHWRKRLSVFKPAVRAASNISHVPLCIIFPICAPFGGGESIGRKTAAIRASGFGRFVTDKVQKKGLFKEDFPSSERTKKSKLSKDIAALQ